MQSLFIAITSIDFHNECARTLVGLFGVVGFDLLLKSNTANRMNFFCCSVMKKSMFLCNILGIVCTL